MTAGREAWSGRIGFILATVGSAVGIGSIWKFPYEVGANGGSAFILFYVLGLVLIVVPLMFAEFAIGRRGRADAPASMAAIAAGHGASRRWAIVGTLGVLTGFLILSFYAVIGGWTAAYAVQTAIGGPPGSDAQAAQGRFDALLASPLQMLAYHALAGLRGFEQTTAFDLLDYLTSNVLLPLGGLAIAVFAGWIVPTSVLTEELRLGARTARALRILLRYVAPLGIAATAVWPLLG